MRENSQRGKCRHHQLRLRLLLVSAVIIIILFCWLFVTVHQAATTTISNSIAREAFAFRHPSIIIETPSSSQQEQQENLQSDDVYRTKTIGSSDSGVRVISQNNHHADAGDNDDMVLSSFANTTPLIEVNHKSTSGNNNSTTNELKFPWSKRLKGWNPPTWVQNYLTWHRKIRAKFPTDDSLLQGTSPEDPSLLSSSSSSSSSSPPPPLLIRYCSRNCGGLHDRLGSLPADLFLANQTGRLLLYSWTKPQKPLTDFLVPNTIDWRFQKDNVIKSAPDIFEGLMDDGDPREGRRYWTNLWNVSVRQVIHRGHNHSVHIYKTRSPFHNSEWFLEDYYWKPMGETDMIHLTPTFGWLWHAFFQPSPGLAEYLQQMRDEMGQLEAGQYTALHIRLLYPDLIDTYAKKHQLKSLYGSGGHDHYGLQIEEAASGVDGNDDENTTDSTPTTTAGRDLALTVGLHAVQCAITLSRRRRSSITEGNEVGRSRSQAEHEPIYFFADANNLVEYMIRFQNKIMSEDSADTTSLIRDDLDRQMYRVFAKSEGTTTTTTSRLVARPDITKRNYHLDTPGGTTRRRPSQDFYATFADLYLALEARCIVFGYGGFGRFAQQLAGNPCYMQHQLHIKDGYYGHSLNMKENVCSHNETYMPTQQTTTTTTRPQAKK